MKWVKNWVKISRDVPKLTTNLLYGHMVSLPLALVTCRVVFPEIYNLSLYNNILEYSFIHVTLQKKRGPWCRTHDLEAQGSSLTGSSVFF